MNTKTLEILVQQRVCYKLAFLQGSRAGHTMLDLEYEVARVANRLLIETGFNRTLWTRVYRNRVFVYNLPTRRAVLELGCISEYTGKVDTNGHRLFKGFELVVMGGIHNNSVADDLNDLLVVQPIKRRVKQYA